MLSFKRRAAEKIIQAISACRKIDDFRSYEEKLINVIQTEPVTRKSQNGHQFATGLSQIARACNGNVPDLSQLNNTDDIAFSLSDNKLKIKFEPKSFTKTVLQSIRESNGKYGNLQRNVGQRRTVCVEFSSPNVAKPFHVGHLRSTIIGNVLSNLYEASGWDVKRVNFIGDWGTQFGLLSLGLMRFSDIEHLKTDPLLELLNVYVQINQQVKSETGKKSEVTSSTYQEGLALFSRLEQGDENMKAVWKMVKDLSAEELNKMYKRLDVNFTHTLAESDYQEQATRVLQKLQQLRLLEYDSKGVGYVPGPDEKSIGKASVVKSDGSSLYLTRDIASALDRQEMFAMERMHYVVDQGQRSHFVKLIHVLNKLSVPWAERPIDDIHVRFGRVKGMSTRKGNVVFLRDVLDEAKSRVFDSMVNRDTTRVKSDIDKIADILGVGAIILQDLKSHRKNDYTFSWERTLNLKADSNVFVQYCHARLCSIVENSGVQLTDDVDVSCLIDDGPLDSLILHLVRYPDVFEESLSELAPHHLVQYLFRLCHLTNATYAIYPVKGESTVIAQARLLVFDCARQVIANCLKLLGVKPLDKV